MDISSENGPSEDEITTSSNVATAEKPGGWRQKLFGRGSKEAAKPVEQPTPTAELNQEIAEPTQEGALQNAETAMDPEVLRASLKADLMRAVDLEKQAYFKEGEAIHISTPQNKEEEELKLAARVEIENLKSEASELRSGLIGRLDASRKILGNFCKVLEDDEGQKAVVLLSPLTREITQTVIGGQQHLEEKRGKPLYETKDTVKDVFYINSGGVFKDTVVIADAHKTEDVYDDTSETAHLLQEATRIRNEKDEKKIYDNRSIDWNSRVSLAFNSEESIGEQNYSNRNEEPRAREKREQEMRQNRKFAIRRFTSPSGEIEGKQQYDKGLAEPIQADYGYSLGGRSQVSTSLDVVAAFDASVELGAKYKGDNEPRFFFEDQPNPVSAEPVSTEVSNSEPVNSETNPASIEPNNEPNDTNLVQP